MASNHYLLPADIEPDIQSLANKMDYTLDNLLHIIYETVRLNGLYEDIACELKTRNLTPKLDVTYTISQMVAWVDKHDEMSVSKEDLILNAINEFKDMLVRKGSAKEDK